MASSEQLHPQNLKGNACKHDYFTPYPYCHTKTEKPESEVISGGKEIKEEKEDLEIGIYTEASSSHPDRNKDKSFAQNEMAGVFESTGDENAGDIASTIASKTIQAELQAIPDNTTLDQKTAALEHAFHKA